MNRRDDAGATYADIFLQVFAPAITGYAEWVLEHALATGKKRVYFLARDGWLMREAAEKIAAERGYRLDIRYLKVSRYALRMAEYCLLGEDCLDLVCTGGIDVTFEKIMKRSGLTDTEAHEIAGLAGYGDWYRRTLSYSEVQQLKTRLKTITPFFEYIGTHSRKCLEDTLGYLEQEGLLDDVPCALADSGWLGTIQRSMERLLSHASGKEVKLEGYYFGLYEIPKDAKAEQYHSFYISPGGIAGRGDISLLKNLRRKVRFSICLFEAVCSSPAGMTLGYEKTGNGYAAVEDGKGNPNAAMMEENLVLLRKYLDGRSGKLPSGRQLPRTCGYPVRGSRSFANRDPAAYVETLLAPCMGTPAKREAEVLGHIQFCDDVLELQMQDVAAAWDKEEQKKQRLFRRLLIKLGVRKEELHESGWPEGSVVLAGRHVRFALWRERMYKRLMYVRKALIRRERQ